MQPCSCRTHVLPFSYYQSNSGWKFLGLWREVMFMVFISLPGWTQNPYFMSRPSVLSVSGSLGQGLYLPRNEPHIASRPPWGPVRNWRQAQGTGRGAKAQPGHGAGRLSLCHPDFANHPNNSLSRSHVFLGEGQFKLVVSEHNKLKTRQRQLKSPRGNQRFYEPVIFTIIQ